MVSSLFFQVSRPLRTEVLTHDYTSIVLPALCPDFLGEKNRPLMSLCRIRTVFLVQRVKWNHFDPNDVALLKRAVNDAAMLRGTH